MHGALRRLEGDLGESGGRELGPDGRRGVGRAAVPGPDHVGPRAGRTRERLDGGVISAAADVAEHPAHEHQVGRHVVGVPARQRRIALDDRVRWPATPAAAARRRAKATRAGSSSTSSAETSSPRGWVASTSITSRPCPAHRLTDPDGTLWSADRVEHVGAPSPARCATAREQVRGGIVVGPVPAHPVRSPTPRTPRRRPTAVSRWSPGAMTAHRRVGRRSPQRAR